MLETAFMFSNIAEEHKTTIKRFTLYLLFLFILVNFVINGLNVMSLSFQVQVPEKIEICLQVQK